MTTFFVPFILSEFFNICFISMYSVLNAISEYTYFYIPKKHYFLHFFHVFEIIETLQCVSLIELEWIFQTRYIQRGTQTNQPLTIITKRSILDVAEVLDLPLQFLIFIVIFILLTQNTSIQTNLVKVLNVFVQTVSLCCT